MRRSLVAATAASVLLLTAACGGSSGESSGSGDSTELTLAAVTPPSSFAVGEMAQSGPEDHYYQAVYDTLLELDEDGQPVANLVTEWSYDETNTRLSLTLRDDVTFSDGTAFDAEAVKANLEAAKGRSGEAGSALGAISSVEVVDATHADVVLSRPDPALLQSLSRSSGYVASPAALASPDLATAPVGSGPYVLDADASTAGSTYVYTRNEDYWNAEDFPYDSLEIRYLDDTTAILNGLRSGEINGVAGGTSDVTTGAENAGLTVTTYTNGGIEGVYLWDRAGALVPALADVRVRQAINFAMDRETIVETVKGGLGEPTVQVFGPNSPAYDESLEDTYEFDVDRAKELMAEAGYADGFSMTLPDFSPVYPDEQAAMTEAFASLGIEVTYSPITGDQVVGSIIGGQWPANFFNLTAGSPFEMIGLTLTQQSPFNPFKNADPEVDRLVQQAQTTSGDEQTAALQELNRYLVDQAWFAPWDAAEGTFITTTDVAVTAVPGVSVPPLTGFEPAGS
ncbi:ABC transporter substrate-binding protein [Geodermatophilus aquaeductus]|jgi:peptide/nickel transport system substrate-binding protein|uniref:Peptide/nickel transport system substrate-binding protein n=1 Tax=Geodermatophilus aquaeductus TaxID=1564161 RepID=A0A521E862_9ACTN|nr:ABC transporter substrate-binding protein [Geodermatophilus aquaeductus]SMO80114.1 peptide/nickel transport system substrate-binding protein [Geodermatophilus aquaeductus]